MRFRELKKHSKQQKIDIEKPSFEYATYPEKIKALITDLFMIYAPILYVITYVIMGSKEAFLASNLAPFIGILSYGLIYSILLFKLGQTPGKKAYDIKVVDVKTLENLSFLKAFCRFIAFLFSATILVGLIIPLFRKDKKALHDIVCGSVEIRRANAR